MNYSSYTVPKGLQSAMRERFLVQGFSSRNNIIVMSSPDGASVVELKEGGKLRVLSTISTRGQVYVDVDEHGKVLLFQSGSGSLSILKVSNKRINSVLKVECSKSYGGSMKDFQRCGCAIWENKLYVIAMQLKTIFNYRKVAIHQQTEKTVLFKFQFND